MPKSKEFIESSDEGEVKNESASDEETTKTTAAKKSRTKNSNGKDAVSDIGHFSIDSIPWIS